MSEWQTIETAPKSGRWILVWWHDVTNAPFVAYYDGPSQAFIEAFSGGHYDSQPTDWMPLPEPP